MTYLSCAGSSPWLAREGESAKVRAKQADMRIELQGSYDEPDRNLWNSFFPDNDPARNGDFILRSIKGFGKTIRPSARPSKGARRGMLTEAWLDMPHPPAKEQQSTIRERDITAALVPIMNAIISHEGLSGTRVAIDCQDHAIPSFDEQYLKPDIFIWGKGSPSFQNVDGIPPSSLRRVKDRNMPDSVHLVDWRWCVIPVEIKTERNRNEGNNKAMFQLATYAREVFAAQPHRRFVPSLLFTESTVEFFLWDRAGVVFSETFDYHAQAARFCRIIATIVSWNDEELGLDTSVRFQGDGDHAVQYITTKSDAYIVDAASPFVTRPYNIRSHGPTCWRSRQSDDSDENIYLIYDTWSDNWACAHVIRTSVEEVRLKNRLLSPAEWVSFQPVHTAVTFPGLLPSRRYVDSVDTNRRLAGVTSNLDHGRSVWKCNGGECVPLEKFDSTFELVCVLRDVVQGMSYTFMRRTYC
jgi:hypothetical protein